ncbi:MAG: NfeD-like C-terminal, partner-binding [Pyrinomonadaceae bacterium]|nr:NfeD-like C-terminal, partner-binding [Pyrinomonadaceae bacterium]
MKDELSEALNLLSAFIHPSSLCSQSFVLSLTTHSSALFSFLHPPAFVLLLVGALLLVVCLIALVVAAMSRHQKSAGRPLHVEGRVGVVAEALEPEGAVLVDGELWRARSRSGVRIARGGRVRVVGARGHWLEVEAVA